MLCLLRSRPETRETPKRRPLAGNWYWHWHWDWVERDGHHHFVRRLASWLDCDPPPTPVALLLCVGVRMKLMSPSTKQFHVHSMVAFKQQTRQTDNDNAAAGRRTSATHCLSSSLSLCLSVCLSLCLSLSLCVGLSVCLIRLVDRVERSLFSMPIRQADRSLPRSRLTDPPASFSASSASEMQNQFVQQEAAEKGVNFVTTSGQIVPATLLLPTTEKE